MVDKGMLSTSSHVAIHNASRALLTPTFDAALVVGIQLFHGGSEFYHQCDATGQKVQSQTDKVRAFDEAADGLLFGEGIAAVVLQNPTPKTRT